MGLSLLAPLMLGLGLLAALPVIAHMSRQKPRDRQPFGAMLLLERVVKRLRRRRRVKDPWLLLLRILAILLAALAVAGPRWSYQGDAPEYGGSGRVVVVVDRSMSMSLEDGGSTLLARARDRASALVRDLPEGTLVGAVAFDAEPTLLSDGLTADQGRIAGRIEAIEPSIETSELGAALLEARRMLEGEPGEVIVYTDEAGQRIVPSATEELVRLVEAGSALVPKVTVADPPRNVSVTGAEYGEGIEGGAVTLTVASFGPEPREVACEVTLPDGQVVPIFADLPPEGEVAERVTVPREALGGVGRAWCDDPDLPADDARYFHLPRVGASRVLVVDGDPGDTPIRSEVYFLERALAPWGGTRTGVTPDVVTPLGLLDLDPETHRVVFLTNVADPRPFAPMLSEFVRKGGSLVVTMGNNVTPERYNAALGSLLPSPLAGAASLAAREEPGEPLQLPDTTLDLFRPFSRAGRASFGNVRSHRIMKLDPYRDSDEVTTLLRFSGGAPALVEHRVGKGRVVVWAGSIDADWGNLPLQASFMPLVQQLVAYLGGESGGSATRYEAMVGEQVVIPLPDLAIEPTVVGPDGTGITSRIEGTSLVFSPEAPGAYEVGLDSAPPMAWVAVNVDPLESDVRRYDSLAAAEAELVPELFVKHIDLAGPSFGLALLLLLIQGLLSIGRRPANE